MLRLPRFLHNSITQHLAHTLRTLCSSQPSQGTSWHAALGCAALLAPAPLYDQHTAGQRGEARQLVKDGLSVAAGGARCAAAVLGPNRSQGCPAWVQDSVMVRVVIAV